MPVRHPVLPLALLLVLAACREDVPQPWIANGAAAAPGGTGGSTAVGTGGTGGAAEQPGTGGMGGMAQAPIPPAPTTPLEAKAFAIPPDGSRRELGPEKNEEIPSTSTFEVTSPLALTDVRVRILEESGKLVPSDDQLQVGVGTVYRVKPREPLEPGAGYRILIDAQRGRFPADVAGTLFQTRTFRFTTAAENGAGGAQLAPPAP